MESVKKVDSNVKWLYFIELFVCIAGDAMLFTVWAPCPEGMKCRVTTYICMGLILAILVAAILTMIHSDKMVIGCIAEAIACVAGFLVVNIYGGCDNVEMACNQTTFPMIKAILAGIILINILKVVIASKRNKGIGYDNQEH